MYVRLTLAYVGSRYAGWQRQANALAVQQVLEEALGRLVGEPVRTVGAGRTDAGVHAAGQVVSFPLTRPFPLQALVHGTNLELPADVRVAAAAETDANFDAQRAAVAKTYVYTLSPARTVAPARGPFVAVAPYELDFPRLQATASPLLGRHDFRAFALAGTRTKTTERRIFAAAWERQEREWLLRIVGEGFLRGMVRSLVGTMLEVAGGKRSLADFARLLTGASREEAGETAPARGLCLERVDYL